MQKTAVDKWGPRLRLVPVVVVISALLLGLWGLRMPGPRGVVCDRVAPGQVYCQATLPRPWAWLPSTTFALQNFTIASDLCDNNPQGGVRFCHRLTPRGEGRQVNLPEVRTPLSAKAITDQLHQFIAGEGSPQLIWSSTARWLPWRSLTIALLLAVASWALWDLRWPPLPPSPLAMDGAERPGRAPDSTT